MVPRNTASIAPDRGPTINMEIAEKYGVDASAMTTKKEVIAAIDAAQEELPAVGGAGDVVD